jgi:hypothetical protein
VSAGIPGIRSCNNATHCLYPIESLTDLPDALRGDFHWLPDPGRRLAWTITERDGREFDPAPMSRLVGDAARLGLRMPASFTRFLGDAELRSRIRSFTGCWLDLPERLAELPDLEGRVFRFLNDQQGAVYLYLALGPDGDRGVVVSSGLLDVGERHDDGTSNHFDQWSLHCAPTFEAFLYGFLDRERALFHCRS